MRTQLLLATLCLFVAQTGEGAAQILTAPDGWRLEIDGRTSSFACEAESCGPGSIVSVNSVPDGPLISLRDFRRLLTGFDRSFTDNPQNNIASVRDIEVFAHDVSPSVKAQTAVKAMTNADGDTRYFSVSEVSDGQRRFTIVASSPTEQLVREHTRSFLVAAYSPGMADGAKQGQ